LEENKPEISGRIEIHGKGYLDFQGNADQVINSILRFLSEIYPSYKVVSDLTISLNLEELIGSLKGLVGISDEGLIILNTDLPADTSIMLCLIGAYISSRIGKMDQETLTTGDITRLIGKAPKTIRNEIPTLIKKGWIDRVGRGEYRVTIAGIVQFQDQILTNL
jgi:hypothetical protein